MRSPLDFAQFEQELARTESPLPCKRGAVCPPDKSRLIYSVFRRAGPVQDALVFYHGGGAHMSAGYQFMASALVRKAPISVCLVDLRGHGASGGQRGHTVKKEYVWYDVELVVDALRKQMPGVRIHLGGHSSGAGMLLNYWTVFRHRQTVSSLIFLAPEFGPYAPVRRIDASGKTIAFSHPRRWAFLMNGITRGRFFGAVPAVDLGYDTLAKQKRPEFVSRYTVNMALAITPLRPAEQLALLDVPTTILAARGDELFCPERLGAFIAANSGQSVRYEILEEARHLNIVLHSRDRVLAAMGISTNTHATAETT
jgi:alpha-beta hydrolase superfamily lysophospholipase